MLPMHKRLLAIGAAMLVTYILAMSHASVAQAQTKPGTGLPQAETATDADKEVAMTHYRDARKRMKAGDHAGALPLYQKAEALVPGTTTKYYIAVCLDKLGRSAEAVAAYKTFIDSRPDVGRHGQRLAKSRQRIAELEAMMIGAEDRQDEGGQ